MFYNEKIFKRCFDYRGKYWYKNIKYIPLYFKQMHFLIKHGYDKYAHWETFNWFIDTMHSILTRYRKNHYGVPIVVDNYPWEAKTEEEKAIVHENELKWDGIIDRMIDLLDDMNESNPKYYSMEYLEVDNAIHTAKDEFFELFSKYFYHLWD